MKEIKFRGLSINGVWNYGLICHDKNKDSEYEWFISNSTGKPYAFGAIEKTVGQFTGLKDKNGKEIYEGDIINVPYNFIGNIHVIFYNGAYNISKYNCEKIEIIGNIHENPELLK